MSIKKNFNPEKIFNIALENHKKNKLEEAEKNYKKLLKLEPKNFNGNFFLGTVYFQRSQFSKAKKIFKIALLLNSHHAELCNNYGATLTQLGECKDAINFLEKAIQLQPNYAEAYNNLGSALKELKEYKKAISLFNKAISIKSNLIDPYINVGIIYKELGDFNTAIIFFKKAITIQPKNIKAHQNLMESFEKTNQFKQLELAIKNATILNINNFIIKLYEGIIYYNNNQFLNAKKILEKIYFNAPDLKNEMIRITTLAKCYDRVGDYKNAFNYFSKANDLSPKIKKVNFHDKDRYLREVEKRKSFFTQKNIKKWKTIKTNNEKFEPIFLVGFPRSGTTLLDTILRTHPLVEVFEEKPAVNKLLNYLNQVLGYELRSFEKINKIEIESAKKIYFDYLNAQTNNKNAKIFIDKLPLNIIHVGEIFKIFPNSKFILSVRHPLDCVLSCFMQDFDLNDAMANFLDLKDAAHLYDSVMKLWFNYISIFKINYHQVKYENLVNDFQNTVNSAFNFLEVPWDDAVSNYFDTAKKRDKIATPSYNQVIKPLYSHADGRWKNYEAQLSSIYPQMNQWINKFDY